MLAVSCELMNSLRPKESVGFNGNSYWMTEAPGEEGKDQTPHFKMMNFLCHKLFSRTEVRQLISTAG